jgi:signal transduction histidine kinase
MKARLTIALSLMVVLPLALLLVLGARTARAERTRIEARLDAVLSLRLDDVAAEADRLGEDLERELILLTDMEMIDGSAMARAVEGSRLARELYILDENREILDPYGEAARLAAFMERTGTVWRDGTLEAREDAEAAGAASQGYGWHTWFYGEGAQYLFWQRLAGGQLAVVEIRRAAVLADLIARLPGGGEEIDAESAIGPTQIRLLGATGHVLYHWGAYEPAAGEAPRASRPLPEPFSAWTLSHYAGRDALGEGLGRSTTFNIVSALVAVTIALVVLALYLHRAAGREIREATQRVGFVGRVSHELKTPLTNIRLYAELLERRIPASDQKARSYLDVLLSESARLSRLIKNVLAFSRSASGGQLVRPGPAVVDDVVRGVLAAFSPALDEAGIVVRFDAGAAREVLVDADGLEQILSNLVSNVEKYARAGGLLEVESRLSGDFAAIRVRDYGPGIPRERHEHVFRPFLRLSDRLSEGASGTGIGLTIARDLARAHGGDLVLEEQGGGAGASFLLTLRTPPSASDRRDDDEPEVEGRGAKEASR